MPSDATREVQTAPHDGDTDEFVDARECRCTEMQQKQLSTSDAAEPNVCPLEQESGEHRWFPTSEPTSPPPVYSPENSHRRVSAAKQRHMDVLGVEEVRQSA